MNNMRYHFRVHKAAEGGYWSECIDDANISCVTQGETQQELMENMQDALRTLLEEPEGSSWIAPPPNDKIKPSKDIVEVVDSSIADDYK